MLAWIVASLFSGCSRFPAIDPNGQSIFLPYPASTQLTVPQIHAGNGNPGIIPQDAYPTPLPPPACVDGSCAQPSGIQNLFQHHQKKKQGITNHFAKKDPSKCGEIQLSPTRIVAPVNGEVLLLAGICGKDGYLLKREPLEWMLAPGSVGQFIEVGDDAKGKLCSSFQRGPKVEKLDVDYARGRTSSKATLLTKGTPGCDDDLEVAEGQTWLSISSPNEGVSRVTVLAPDSELWDKRRQTATIYWVDSQANFPDPIRIDSVQSYPLSTRVTSAENMRPAVGWNVRYTIVDPNVLEFVRSAGEVNSNIYVAPVREDSLATVQVRARGPVGVTPVHMEVIRPMQPAENLPELILHQADTFVTVSAPGLDLVVNGPELASVGDVLEYRIALGNPGDINAENAKLRLIAPVGTTVVDARPQPDGTVEGGLLWTQGVLEAGRQVEFVVHLRIVNAIDAVLQLDAEAVGLSRSVKYPIRAVKPAVNVSMVRVPENNTSGQAEVGEVVFYEVGVRNTGTQALVNLVAQIDTSVGWQEANSGSNSRSLTIPMLQPGQVEVIPLALRVVQEGPLQAKVTIKTPSGEALAESPPVGVTGTPPRARRPGVDASIKTEPQAQTAVGQPTKGFFIVTNTGETPLENLDVTIRFDEALEARQVDTENSTRVRQIQGDRTTLHWSPLRLMPGQFAQLTVLFLPRAATGGANLAISVVDGESRANASGAIAIFDPNASGGAAGPNNIAPGTQPGGLQNRTGAWQLLFEPLQNPTSVGNRVTIPVEIRNAQNLPDKNLVVKIALPEGMELNGIQRGGEKIDPTQTERGIWTLPTIQFVRANDTVSFFLIVTPRVVEQATIAIAVSSEGQPTPQVQRRTFTVNPRPQ